MGSSRVRSLHEIDKCRVGQLKGKEMKSRERVWEFKILSGEVSGIKGIMV